MLRVRLNRSTQHWRELHLLRSLLFLLAAIFDARNNQIRSTCVIIED